MPQLEHIIRPSHPHSAGSVAWRSTWAAIVIELVARLQKSSWALLRPSVVSLWGPVGQLLLQVAFSMLIAKAFSSKGLVRMLANQKIVWLILGQSL